MGQTGVRDERGRYRGVMWLAPGSSGPALTEGPSRSVVGTVSRAEIKGPLDKTSGVSRFLRGNVAINGRVKGLGGND